VEVWNTQTEERTLLLQDVAFGVCAFHPSQERVLAGLGGRTVGIWDLPNATELARFELPGIPMLLRLSPAGERFAVVYTEDNQTFIVSIHRLSDGRELRQFEFTEYVGRLDWDPSGRWIAVAEDGGGLHLVNPDTGDSRVLGHHKAQAILAVFDPTGNYLLSAGWDHELICWDLRRWEKSFTIGLNSFQAQWRNDGQACAFVTDQEVQLYSFEKPSGFRNLEQNLGARLHDAAFSQNGRRLAASGSKQLAVWDLDGDDSVVVADKAGDTRLFFSPHEELFATRDDAWFRWRLESNEKNTSVRLLSINLLQEEDFTSLCLTTNKVIFTSPKGSHAVSLTDAEPTESNWVPTIDGVTRASSDGRWLGIFAPYSRFLHIYRLPGLEEIAVLKNSSSIATFEFSPLGDELAVCSPKGVELWSTATWQPMRILTDFVSLLYAPDAKSFWLTKDFRNAGLYDAQTLDLLLPLPPGTRPLAISPDGRRLAVSIDASHLQVWDLQKIRTDLKELGLDR
jgi:WD40 repeat protein